MTESGAAHEPVGSVSEEAFKLFRALTASSSSEDSDSAASDDHVCSTGWCPVCQIVGFIRENPEAVASVTKSATDLARSVRELIETALAPQERP